MSDSTSESIPDFYKGRSVFITGFTGYIGKLVVEKLLRSCPDIKTVYALIRDKKAMTAQERVEKLKNDIVFRVLREQNPKALDKILAIPGDIAEVGLGIKEEDKKLLKNVSVVYHIAASVRFDDFLDVAILTNVRSTRYVIELASEFDRVDSFVYVGTAYSNCDRKEIDEVFYPPKIDWREAIKMAESTDQKFKEKTIAMTQKIIEPMPNTYVFTKGLAEAVVKDLCEDRFPTCVVRPSVVAPSIEDPFTGYVDNFNGSIQMFLAAAYGICKVLHAPSDTIADHVYVDNVAKASIIASWTTAKQKSQEIKIYNATSDWGFIIAECFTLGFAAYKENPVKFYLGPLTTSVVNNNYVYYVYNILFHLIPALFLDLILKLAGIKFNVLRLRRKCVVANAALFPFLKNTWIFANKNYVQLDDALLDSDRDAFGFARNRQKKGELARKKTSLKNFKLFLVSSRIFLIPNEREQATEAEVKRYHWILMADKTIKSAFWATMLYIVCLKYNLQGIITNNFVNYIGNL